MTVDPWTRICLSAIALALLVIAFKPGIPEAQAQEASTVKCEITGGHFTIDKFEDELEVKVEPAFGSPGSTRSSPHYVKLED